MTQRVPEDSMSDQEFAEYHVPDGLDLEETDPSVTYLDHHQRVWIGAKWDVGLTSDNRFAVYRKGNYVTQVGTWDLACALALDNLGYGNG